MSYTMRVEWGPHLTVDISDMPRTVKVGNRDLPRKYWLHGIPSDDDTRPAYKLDVEIVDGAPQCRGLHITSTDHGREVRRIDHIDLALEDLIEFATQTVAQWPRGEVRNGQSFELNMLDPFIGDIRRARRAQRRRGPTDAQLQEAAALYAKTVDAPVAEVAEHFGIARRTASLWIKRAREAGML
jgi:hypothetical protein